MRHNCELNSCRPSKSVNPGRTAQELMTGKGDFLLERISQPARPMIGRWRSIQITTRTDVIQNAFLILIVLNLAIDDRPTDKGHVTQKITISDDEVGIFSHFE